jgi:hypothetical protein
VVQSLHDKDLVAMQELQSRLTKAWYRFVGLVDYLPYTGCDRCPA